MPTYPDLTPEIARRALCQAGFSYAAEALTIDAREERWVASLPDGRDAALEVYEPAVGRRLDRDRIRLYNAACAIGYLAFRSGVPPDQKSCGRTLAEDLRWVRTSVAKLK